MRYLAIDFGLKRLGLAVSDPKGKMAFPYRTLYKQTNEMLFQEIGNIIRQENIEAIILGLPMALNGDRTLITRQVENFSRRLKARFSLPVHLVDEALTSAEAEEKLRQANVPISKRKAILDQQSAVEILNSFLSSLPK